MFIDPLKLLPLSRFLPTPRLKQYTVIRSHSVSCHLSGLHLRATSILTQLPLTRRWFSEQAIAGWCSSRPRVLLARFVLKQVGYRTTMIYFNAQAVASRVAVLLEADSAVAGADFRAAARLVASAGGSVVAVRELLRCRFFGS